jgi:hypothetical protein
MNDWAGVDRALGELAASGAVEAREDGEWLAGLSAMQTSDRVVCEVQSLDAPSLAGWNFSAQIRHATPGA